jgi:ribosomal protein L24
VKNGWKMRQIMLWGKRVKVNRGSMKGLEGRLVQILGKQRVKVEIDAIQQSVFVKIPKGSLDIIP